MRKKNTTKVKAHRANRRKASLKRGGIAFYALIGVIIVGAFFLVGGVNKFTLSPTDTTPAGEVIVETPGQGKDSLQLNTIRFKQCASTAAVDFLVDTSGSMRSGGKLQNIEDSLKSFASNFTDKSITGIRRFSSDDNFYCPPHPITQRLTPIDFYSANKSSFSNSASTLCADGATNTRTAFAAELADLTQAVTDQRFKNYNFNLVFISDGIPEERGSGHLGACNANEPFPLCATSNGNCRCFADTQDPTTNPQIAKDVQALKNINGKNVRIFSVLVFDPATDGPFESKLTTMMTNIASSPSDFHKTTDPTTIKSIFAQISNKICSSQQSTP